MNSFVKSYLQSLTNFELQVFSAKHYVFNLTRIHKLLKALENPQDQYPIIHVVGTKGKGSTSLFLASLLRESGLKVGLYTSPHLYDEKERIRILAPQKKIKTSACLFEGRISSVQLERILKTIKLLADRCCREKRVGALTFFEVMTAAAFYFFAEQKVDVAVVEAGLGGRLDATNAGGSQLCVFTPISYDHVHVLGSTLTKIAREKAAVIKASTQVIFSAPQSKEARAVIQQRAGQFQKEVFELGKDFFYQHDRGNWQGEIFSFQGFEHYWRKLKIPLMGVHQIGNASLALAAVEYFLRGQQKISDQVIRRGLARAVWPARGEVLRRDPFVVIDSAHNEDSVKKLAETILKVFPGKRIIILFGASRDKNIRGMLKVFMKLSQDIIFTKASHPRSFDFSKEQGQGMLIRNGVIIKDLKEGFRAAWNRARKHDVILVAGSIFLAAEARKLCTRKA